MDVLTVNQVMLYIDAAVGYLVMTNPWGSGDEKKTAAETDAASFAFAAGAPFKRGDAKTLPAGLRDLMRNGKK